MNRKVFYIFVLFILITIGSTLVYFKIKNSKEIVIQVPVAKTVIPEVSIRSGNKDDDSNIKETQIASSIFLELRSDESFVDAITVDLNADGVEDQVIAVKRLLDPFVYLIVSIQDPITQKWDRIKEIKTQITEPKSLSFNIIPLADLLPAIIYSGITSDNQQTLAIQKILKKEKLVFEEVIALNADIQIEVKKLQQSSSNEITNFDSFKIYTYDSDPEAPNTFNQIKTEYLWNYNTSKYEKGIVLNIPGEKIETKLLRKLKTGNTDSILEFLSGLWFKTQNVNSDVGRSFYFDQKNKEIIFNLDNIQEIYEISSISNLRYGLFFTTHNKSIPNIILKISMEVKGVDEIKVRVIENVRRIKFGTTSLWSGIYKKASANNFIQNETNTSSITKIKETISKNNKEWSNDDNIQLLFLKNTYKLFVNKKQETGIFNFFEVENKLILQLRNNKNQSNFYLVKFIQADRKESLTLTKINLNLNEIMITGEDSIQLVREN